ncbi:MULTISPECIES: hypothetical protein [Neisseria]|nr:MULTISPECIES: hypothetical protein [Neisseria]
MKSIFIEKPEMVLGVVFSIVIVCVRTFKDIGAFYEARRILAMPVQG